MSLTKCMKRKRTSTSFKSGVIEEVVETDSLQSEHSRNILVRSQWCRLFGLPSYEARTAGDFTTASEIEESNRERSATVQMCVIL